MEISTILFLLVIMILSEAVAEQRSSHALSEHCGQTMKSNQSADRTLGTMELKVACI